MIAKMDSEFDVYAYTMVWDTGFAPAVSSDVLSLACCKTFLRYKLGKCFQNIDKDIYVIGICGKQLAERAEKAKRLNVQNAERFPVYIAKVTNAVHSSVYFSCKEYINRPDAQYLFKDGKWYYRKNNPHHTPTGRELTELENWESDKDIMYIHGKNSKPVDNYVLLSTEYLYFGNKGNTILKDSKELRAVCEERERACRSDLSPIKCLDDKGKMKLLEFIEKNKGKYSEQPSSMLLDKYFCAGGSCKKERNCR